MGVGDVGVIAWCYFYRVGNRFLTFANSLFRVIRQDACSAHCGRTSTFRKLAPGMILEQCRHTATLPLRPHLSEGSAQLLSGFAIFAGIATFAVSFFAYYTFDALKVEHAVISPTRLPDFTCRGISKVRQDDKVIASDAVPSDILPVKAGTTCTARIEPNGGLKINALFGDARECAEALAFSCGPSREWSGCISGNGAYHVFTCASGSNASLIELADVGFQCSQPLSCPVLSDSELEDFKSLLAARLSMLGRHAASSLPICRVFDDNPPYQCTARVTRSPFEIVALSLSISQTAFAIYVVALIQLSRCFKGGGKAIVHAAQR